MQQENKNQSALSLRDIVNGFDSLTNEDLKRLYEFILDEWYNTRGIKTPLS